MQTSDVKYLGIFDAKGKVDGPFESERYNRTNNSGGRVLGIHDGFEIRGEFSLANANPGDILQLTPNTKFNYPNGDAQDTSHVGVRISQSSEWQDVSHDGVVIGQYRTIRSSVLELKFNDAISEVKAGTVTLSAPVMVWDMYTSPKKNGFDGENWDGKGFNKPVEATSNVFSVAIPNSGEKIRKHIGTIGTVRFLTVTPNTTRDRNAVYDNSAPIVDSENFTVRRIDSTIELPAGANGTVTLAPDVDGDRHADWYLADDVKMYPTFDVYGKKGTPEEYESTRMTYEDVQAKFPGLKVEATKTGRGITVTTSGVPENVKPFVQVRPGASGAVGNATYLEGGSLYYGGTFTGTVDGVQVTKEMGNVIDVIAAIPGQPSISGLTNVKRKGDLSGSIAGKSAGLGTDGSVAPIGGTKQTFQFFVKNTGDALLAAPIVTLPNGKKLPIKNVAINPNGTGSFSVDYDVPAGSGALNFDVSLGKAELSPSNTVSFRYSQSSQADSVLDSFGYPQDNPVTVEQEKTVKSPAPKDAPKDTKYRIDRTTNPNLQWATVDQNTGEVTLSPSSQVIPGNYEVPVEATFPDGSKRTITLPVVVTGQHPADRVKEFEKKVKDLEKELEKEREKSDADRKKIADLEKELAKAKAELAATKEALKRAQDAADKAQESANNAQKTANQALKDLAAERERVNDLTKRADKTEKDLKNARERVAALEKENKAQQAQIDQARKDVADLQGTTRTLRSELEAAKKRVTALEEQNKAQQSQIDGLRKDLSKAESRITSLEKELAQTRLELADVTKRLGIVEDRLNTGLGKCVGTVGGSLAALVPALLLASQFAGGSNIAPVDTAIANFQRQIGMYNPEVAKFVDQNRGAIAAGFAGLGILALLFVPGTCGDASLGEAIAEPLSSAREQRKAERENGEGTTAGSSLEVGADDNDAEGTVAGSSSKETNTAQ